LRLIRLILLFLSLPLDVYLFGVSIGIRVIDCRTLNPGSVLFVFRVLCFGFHKTEFESYVTTGFLARGVALPLNRLLEAALFADRGEQ
jgi:hypothetical protein